MYFLGATEEFTKADRKVLTTDAGKVATNSSVPRNESLGRNSINKKGTTSLIFHFGHLPLNLILFYFIKNAPTLSISEMSGRFTLKYKDGKKYRFPLLFTVICK